MAIGDPMHISYDPAGNGGVTITIRYGSEPDGPLAAAVTLDHQGALIAAGHILRKSGVARAEYENARIQEMARP